MASDVEMFLAVIESRLAHVHTAMPGKVESYDAEKQVVSVKPQLKTAYPDGEGDYTHKEIPVIPNVPVAFPRAGGFFLSFPIQKGDYVLLVFSERSIQAWRDKGTAVDPGDLALHPLDGAVAIPGVFPSASALADADATDMILGKDGTEAAQIKITSNQVHLGGGDQFVALANKVNENFDVLYNLINSLFGAASAAIVTTAPAAPDAVYVAIKAALAALVIAGQWPLDDTAAINVKAT